MRLGGRDSCTRQFSRFACVRGPPENARARIRGWRRRYSEPGVASSPGSRTRSSSRITRDYARRLRQPASTSPRDYQRNARVARGSEPRPSVSRTRSRDTPRAVVSYARDSLEFQREFRRETRSERVAKRVDNPSSTMLSSTAISRALIAAAPASSRSRFSYARAGALDDTR